MKRPRSTRIPYAISRIARLAYLAGRGCSGPEIGAQCGMKAGHVYWLAFQNQIPLAQKSADEISFPIIIKRKAMDDFEALARELGHPPEWMISRLLEAVVAERNVARNLLDGVKPPHG